VKTSGFLANGELVHFKFNSKGKIISLLYCGMSMWPEAHYLKMIAGKKKIGGKARS
jgi:hypothetical protein